MLILKVLQAKKIFDKLGTSVTDLTRRSISFLGIDKVGGELYAVEPEVVMRPDLIANSFLSSSANACLLMKYNGISNPFSINEGQILRIPKAEDLDNFLAEPENIIDNRVREAVDLVKPKTVQDAKRLEYLKNKGALAVPSNVALDDGVKVINGRIVFGADVTSIKKEDCPDPISRAKLKETLLKNKIFK
jgi:hypothetical protein